MRTLVTGRAVLMITVLAILSAATGAVALASSTGTLNAAPAAADQEQGMVDGAPFRDPPNAVEDAGADGAVTVTLDAHDTRFDLAGRTVQGQSYNGSYVAPTIRFDPGAHVDVTLVNHLPVATNVHFHGLHIDPSSHSDDDFLCVAPGDTYTYRLVIPANHPQGTYWYHSHAMASTCPNGVTGPMAGDGMTGPMTGDVENQIFAGLSGAMIVGDDRTLLPPAYQHITAHTLVLKDVQIDPAGNIVQNTGTTRIDSNAPTIRLVNGQLRPVLRMRPNETQLWRLINAGADIFYRLRLDGYRFTVVGEDGVPVAGITTAGTLLLPPAKRYDVLVTANSTAGASWLRTTAYSNGPQGDQYPDTALMQLNVAGGAVGRLPVLTGAVRTAPAGLDTAPIAQQRTVDLSESPDGLTFFINGEQFDPDASVFATPAHLGTVEEWTILNESGEDHPFHLHTTTFQEMSVNGTAVPYTHMQDIVLVPHASSGVPGKVVIRVPIEDFPGRWLFHCHIAAHEDNGMMSFVNVES
ncbi:suppressor of ftsI [Catenulispora sp. GP43]|uniref:multicopper oxidase family protein n=1 Tax=Catenulispora sp. GP43 TaxID=3156263 RepID=UPI003515E289